jgi:hypothetical protein
VLLRPKGSVGHVVHSRSSGARNVNALFFMLGCPPCGFNKKRVRTSYTELVFLRMVGSTGHLVHSIVSGVRNIAALFSCSSASGAVSIKSTPG